MTRQVVGEAVYTADLDTAPLAGGVRRAENQLRASGTAVDTGFARPATGALGRVAGGLDNLSRKGGAFGAVMQGLGVGAGFGAFELGTRIVGGAVSAMSDAINNASDLGETVSKSSQIFGAESMPALERWAATASDVFGQSKRGALDGAANFAIFGKSAGLAGGDLVGFATGLTELSSDLASFHNTSPEDAIIAIGAALRGESEPIRRYGVLLDDATLRQRALQLGLIETTKNALTPQQRVLAAQAEILRQTSDASGDFERTSDGLANSQRSLGARLEDVSVELGEKLLPAATAFVGFIADVAVPGISWFTDNVLGPLLGGLGSIGEGFREAASDVHHFAMNFGDQGDRVHELADKMGVDFHDLKTQISDRMVETGENFETATKAIENAWIDTGAALDHETERAMNALDRGVRDGTVRVEREFERIAKVPASLMAAENRAIRDAAFQHQVEYAKGLLDGQNEPLVQMEALKELQAETLDKSAEVARLKGQLTSKRLALGLADDRPAVRAQAEAVRLAIINQLANLGEDASLWGEGIAASMAAGLNNGYGMVRTAAGGLAAAVRGQVGIESEPKDTQSPLYGHTRWMGNFVDDLVADARAHIGNARAVARDLGAALRPDLTADGLGGRLAASASIHGDASAWTGTLTVRVDGGAGMDPATGTAIGEGIGRELNASGLLGALRLQASVS